MKKIKEKEHKPWCKWCLQGNSSEPLEAVWRTSGVALNKHACEEHKEDLKVYEIKYRDDGYMSEGDYQSWGRF